MTPLVLLDIDGVLNPDRHRRDPGPGWDTYESANGYIVAFNPAHGQMALDTAARTGSELAWASSWEHLANREISPRLGLPELAVIPVNAEPDDDEYGSFGVLWKTVHIARYAEVRPFVWLDDHVGAADSDYFDSRPDVGEHLIIEVEPYEGLQAHHLDQAIDWLGALTR
jgi:hypothetical protein